ncbi:hypothetical protein ACEU6E_10845 (plasmid) [Halorutilales archaeon Cl-col2-1]
MSAENIQDVRREYRERIDDLLRQESDKKHLTLRYIRKTVLREEHQTEKGGYYMTLPRRILKEDLDVDWWREGQSATLVNPYFSGEG